VLIQGETGCGKDVVARGIHDMSDRASGPLVVVNCAAIPDTLLESELFGHTKGAFSGADQAKEGLLAQANGGTLFLDEIGDMPAATQTRLLRVLQDGEFFRVGGVDSITADVRIIAATHQKLETLVESGEFREDLFHRLNVIRIHVPKLSERREDIPQLLTHFLRAAGNELDVEAKTLSEEALALLTQLPWPGNVRQLENTCRWLTVMAAGREVLLSDLPPELLTDQSESTRDRPETWHEQLAGWANRQLSEGQSNVLRQALPLFESIMIEAALRHTGGRKAEAAELLGWGRNTLTRKLKDLDLPAA
jgi:two-component system nitrogen regulation response regulator GlnG